MMNKRTHTAARMAAYSEAMYSGIPHAQARHDAALEDVNRHMAARRHRDRHQWAEGAADALLVMACAILAFFICCGIYILLKGLLSLIF